MPLTEKNRRFRRVFNRCRARAHAIKRSLVVVERPKGKFVIMDADYVPSAQQKFVIAGCNP